jgi:hypothetical protein
MDEFIIEEASRLRENLDRLFEPLGITFNTFSEAGSDGIFEIDIEGITRASSTFADVISSSVLFVPKEVIRAMCLGAAYIEAAHLAHEAGHLFAYDFLTRAAEEIGFCRGMACGAGIEDEYRRAALSINGKKGAHLLHGPRAELKAWALSQAMSNRGSDTDIARKLATQIPKHLAGKSKDPERLIYDALRAQKKSN